MTILINNQVAALKKGVSFDYISENSFFTGADGYSLTITFPLKGCSQNLAIFGHINRKDANLYTLLLPCEIFAGSFHKTGSISIVEINETEVKTQFLEGRSVINFHSRLDELYLDEMDFGSAKISYTEKTSFYMRTYKKQKEDDRLHPDYDMYLGHVYLPWINNTSGVSHNIMLWNNNDDLYYQPSWGKQEMIGQPFFMDIIEKSLKIAGYKADLSVLENSQWAYLIICNALPMSWNLTAQCKAFPHWTVSQFLEQVELLTNGEFVFNEQARTVHFRFIYDAIQNIQTVELKNVIDSHKVEVEQSEDVKNEYCEEQDLAYADGGHHKSKYYSASWVPFSRNRHAWLNIATMKLNLDSYLTCTGALTHPYYKQYHYCQSEDTYFILRAVKGEKSGSTITHTLVYQPVNFVGPRTSKEEPDNPTEISIVPVCIDNAGEFSGDEIFLECGEMDEEDSSAVPVDTTDAQTPAAKAISEGVKEKRAYFDKLFVAFWDGNYLAYKPCRPHPYIDPVEITPDGVYRSHPYSLRLQGRKAIHDRQIRFRIDPTQKFTFSFLSDTIPNVQSIFYVHGKKYLAEKITCSFSENGMSRLLKMVAYRVISS